jgi:CsoR family transcriptional regulator, copper-sensing transcriptional repressor
MVDPTPGGVDRPDERKTMLPLVKRDALNRLKTVRGHLDGIIRMVEEDAYCVDLMKQVSAAQASLERVNRLVLKNHLETCFAEAVAEGRSQAAVAELVDAVKFNPVLTGPGASLSGSATNEARAATGGTGGEHR